MNRLHLRTPHCWALLGVLALAVGSFVVGRAAATDLQLGPAGPAGRQFSSTQLISAAVTEDFGTNGNVALAGRATAFNGGGGTTTGAAWASYVGGTSTPAAWQLSNGNPDAAARTSGGSTFSVALIEWLSRRSELTVSMEIDKNTTTANGIVMGANQTGTTGLVAVVYKSEKDWWVGLRQLTGGNSWTTCGTDVNFGDKNHSEFGITLNYSPKSGGAASATFTAAKPGGGPETVACTPSATANGTYAGLFSQAQATRNAAAFVDFTATMVGD